MAGKLDRPMELHYRDGPAGLARPDAGREAVVLAINCRAGLGGDAAG